MDEFEMKDHYDFRGAQRGKFYCPQEKLKITVHLDTEDTIESTPTESTGQ